MEQLDEILIEYDAIVKTRKKRFRKTAKFSKSLEIPFFKSISVLFPCFVTEDRQSQHVNHCPTLISVLHPTKED